MWKKLHDESKWWYSHVAVMNMGPILNQVNFDHVMSDPEKMLVHELFMYNTLGLQIKRWFIENPSNMFCLIR